MGVPGWSRTHITAIAAVGLAAGGWSGLALSASAAGARANRATQTVGAPTPPQVGAVGSPPRARLTQPGSTVLPANQPLIVVSFSGGRIVTLGGSAAGSVSARAAAVPASAAECFVNFTQRVRPLTSRSVTVRWYGGISCTRRMTLFGEAWLAESATAFDASGNHYQGQLVSVASGRPNTIVRKGNPSLYIWHASNFYFPELPSRGVLAVLPSPGQVLNGATACKGLRSSTYGFGIHCDLYSQRF